MGNIGMKGLDNWLTGGNFHRVTIDCKCPKGHIWEAPGFSEYGSVEFKDEVTGPICPECGEMDIETQECM